jgi:hypothetical protein
VVVNVARGVSQAVDDDDSEDHPAGTKTTFQQTVYGCGSLALLLLVCSGIFSCINSRQLEELAEADKLFAKGDVSAAVERYKPVYPAAGRRKAEVLNRIVSYEIGQGNQAEAEKWVGKGFHDKVEVAYQDPTAQGMLFRLQQEQADRAAREQAQREAKTREREEAAQQRLFDQLSKLVRDLQDPDGAKREEAAKALGRLGPKAKDAVPALLGTYGDQRLTVWGAASASIRQIGAAAVPSLVDALQRTPNPNLRFVIIESLLKEMGPAAKDAVPILVAALRVPPTEDDPLCFNAASALVAIDPGRPEIVPVLVQALSYNSLTRGTALDDLSALGPRAKPALPALRQVAAGRLPLKHPAKPAPAVATPGPLHGGSEQDSLRHSQAQAAELVRQLAD